MKDLLLNSALILAFGYIVNLILSSAMIKFSNKFGVLSLVDFRRKKANRVPLLGGTALYTSLVILYFVFDLSSFKILLLSAIPLVAVGIIDDIYELSPKFKTAGHLASVVTWIYLINSESISILGSHTPSIITYVLIGFWILGIINALNMIDGMDLEAITFNLVSSVFIIFLIGGVENSAHILAMIGASLAFFTLNKVPAKLYLGDTGSTFIGFYLATTAITIPFAEASFSPILIPLFLLAFPEMDAITAIYRRVKSRTGVTQGDHDHIHHKLLKIGFTILQANLILAGTAAYCGLTALLIAHNNTLANTIGISALSILALLSLMGSIYILEHKKAQQVSSYSRSLIQQIINHKDDLIISPQKFRMSVFDLLPYYKELQQKGIISVQEFIQEFSEYATVHFKDANVSFYGSYTIIYTEDSGNTSCDIQELTKDFYRLISKHEIQKNNSGLPWGLAFYSDNSDDYKILDKFNVKYSEQVTLKQVS